MILSTTSDTTLKSCIASFVRSVCLYVLGFYNPTCPPPRISRYAFRGRPAVAVKVVSRSPCCSSVETISLKALASIFMSFSSELWVSCLSGASCNLRIRRKQSARYRYPSRHNKPNDRFGTQHPICQLFPSQASCPECIASDRCRLSNPLPPTVSGASLF